MASVIDENDRIDDFLVGRLFAEEGAGVIPDLTPDKPYLETSYRRGEGRSFARPDINRKDMVAASNITQLNDGIIIGTLQGDTAIDPFHLQCR